LERSAEPLTARLSLDVSTQGHCCQYFTRLRRPSARVNGAVPRDAPDRNCCEGCRNRSGASDYLSKAGEFV